MTNELLAEISLLKEKIARLEKERDAAVDSLRKTFGSCIYCKYFDSFTQRCKSKPEPGKCWEWRGVQDD